MSDTAIGYPLELALYLEGVRIPFISATATSRPGHPSSCTIQLPPFPAATRIRPRTMVQLFYLDVPFIDPDTNAGSERWRLLFEGEVSHSAITKDQGHMSVSIVCQDYTNYWFHVYQYFINNYKSITATTLEMAAFVNAISANNPDPDIDIATIYNTDVPGTVGDFVLDTILKGRSNIIVGLLDLIAKIGGEASKSIKAVNQFFGRAEKRLRMARRAFYIPDKELSKLLNIKVGTAAINVMNQFGGMVNQQGSIYEVIMKFLAHANYNFVNFLAPPFNSNPSRDIGPTGTVDNSNMPNNLPASPAEATILSSMFKPSTVFCLPPKCNILFPSRTTSFQYSRSFFDEPTRYRMSVVNNVSATGVPFTGASDTLQEFVVYAPPLANLTNPNTGVSQSPLVSEAAASLEVQKIFINEELTLAQKIEQMTIKWFQILREYGDYDNGDNLIFDPSRDVDEPEIGIVPTGGKLDQTQSFYVEQLGFKETGDEDPQGLVSPQDKVTQLLGTKTGDAYDRTKFLIHTANYNLDLIKFSYRNVEGISGPFNPNLLVGFPAVILSSTAIIVGELASVTHRMSANGGAVTDARMTHASSFPVPAFVGSMTEDQIQDYISSILTDTSNALGNNPVTGIDTNKFSSPKDGSTVELKDRSEEDFPPFLNQEFNHANIDGVYTHFGTASVFSFERLNGFATPLTGGARDRFVAGLVHYLEYLCAIDKEKYVNSVTKRNITTINDYRTNFGLTSTSTPIYQERWGNVPGDEFLFGNVPGAGPVFKDYRNGTKATKQEEILKLAKEMRIALGKEPNVNTQYDVSPIFGPKRSGGAASGE